MKPIIIDDFIPETYASEQCEEFELTVQQRVSPKKGRAIIFDSHQIHSGQVPENNDYRIVINCIFG